MSKSTSADQLIAEIISLREQYQLEVGSKRKPWPKSIKIRIVELDRLGVSMRHVSSSIGISYQTIMSWRLKKRRIAESKKIFHAIAVKDPTVTVGLNSLPVRSGKIQPLDLTVTVRTPDGFIIEIPASMTAQVLSTLRCGK